MPNRLTLPALRRRPRRRTAVLAAGLCASMAVGAGVAVAAQPGAGQDVFAAGTAAELADATRHQADTQYKAVAAEKAAEARQAAEKKKADRSAARSWTTPVGKPYDLTASFGNSGDRWSAKHSGQDFAVPTGTPVESVHKGTVVTTGWGGAYGNRVVVEHPGGRFSQYAHLSKINVSPGQQVNTGSKIALSGNTGNTSGPHLHFEIRTTPAYGSGFDPVPFLKSHGAKP